jgi:hypothetical protein
MRLCVAKQQGTLLMTVYLQLARGYALESPFGVHLTIPLMNAYLGYTKGLRLHTFMLFESLGAILMQNRDRPVSLCDILEFLWLATSFHLGMVKKVFCPCCGINVTCRSLN